MTQESGRLNIIAMDDAFTPDAPEAANDENEHRLPWRIDQLGSRTIDDCDGKQVRYPDYVDFIVEAANATSRLRALEEGNRALVDAAENAVIAFGMGWDMEGVIDRLSEVAGVLKS